MTSTSSVTDPPREPITSPLPEPVEGSTTSTSSATDTSRELATSPLPELAEGSAVEGEM